MSARVETARENTGLQREWWLRTLLVFQNPRPLFAALRDDSDEAAQARAEPILAIVYLAGIAGVLATSIAGRLLDDPAVDGLVVAGWAFIGGGFYGFGVYWGLGGALHVATRLLGSQGSYRRARHLLGFAAAPIALSLFVVWPIELAVYGEDVFRSGGSDSGTGNHLFRALEILFLAWACLLLVPGVKTVHGWTWARAAVAVTLAAALPALVVAASVLR